MKEIAEFSSFESLDIRSGTVVSATPARTKKPTLKMEIDFGLELGVRTSCGAYTNYAIDDIVGKTVVGIINFPRRQMGPEFSEVLVLGVKNPEGEGTIPLSADKPIPNGSIVF